MTKKKTSRPKHQKDVGDTSEEELKTPHQGKMCPHVQRAVNFGRVRKALKLGNFNSCNGGCEEEEEELWLCLQCGHAGCGRGSEGSHALQHFRTLHSDCHALVLSPASGCIWCYDCDEEVRLQCSNVLRQCVEFVLKISVNSSNKLHNQAAEKQQQQLSLIECVLKEQSVVAKVQELKKEPEKEAPPSSVKGLRNLGNTCFFNAVMQSLSQTQLLVGEVESFCSAGGAQWTVPKLAVEDDLVVEDTQAEPLRLELSRECQLLSSFLKFLRQMTSPARSKGEVVNPSDLFNEIQRKSPQFQHYHQQDSHELLRQFLDHLRQEEVKRQKKAILKNFKIGNANQDISDYVRKLIKAYGAYASHTLVERVFGGLLVSTVLCEECKTSSQIFEPFMDLSLPLFEEKQQDQLCPLLDGGKDTKACRKFSRASLDENEYVLSRPKQDPGKPSKHLEKKQKMMMKKQKKAQRKKPYKKEAENGGEEQEEEEGESSQTGENTPEVPSLGDVPLSEALPESSGLPVADVEEKPDCNGVEEDLSERMQALSVQVRGVRIRRDSDRTAAALSADDEEDAAEQEEEEEEWGSEAQTQEWVVRSLRPLQPRPRLPPHECSVRSCLAHFTRPELLAGANKFRCDHCTQLKRRRTGDEKAVAYSNASKQLLVFNPPAVLTLHLKRFQQVGMSLRKVNRFVEFPLQLDLAPYCSSACRVLPHMSSSSSSVLYSLYAVVEHSGRLTSGHYTAFVRLQPARRPRFLNASAFVPHGDLAQLLRRLGPPPPSPTPPQDDDEEEAGGRWFHVSDSTVRPASEEQVLRCQAYLLFYERVK